ncbi:MAG TPA: SH3 domain-containing protein, partial [Polyangiaceae bacterium]|nr:SH3 domain-containing protein [Polyangiaceae bacterium]
LGRVGIIAIVGFGIGVAWPHLAGVRLVPTLPNESGSSKEDLSGAPPEAKPQASAVASALPPPPAPDKAPSAPDDQPPVVGEGQVTSCSDGGKRLKSCDDVDFDRVARAPIEALEGCDAARRISGVLSLGFDLDFGSERVTRVSSGKTTTLSDKETGVLLDCYRQAFAKLSLSGIPHEHQGYSVFYRIELKGAKAPPGTGPAGTEGDAAPGPVTPASGSATVTWNTALIRQTPDREGKTIARVLQGTRVGVTGRSGDWYRVKYDAKGNQGWVFRTAIGM